MLQPIGQQVPSQMVDRESIGIEDFVESVGQVKSALDGKVNEGTASSMMQSGFRFNPTTAEGRQSITTGNHTTNDAFKSPVAGVYQSTESHNDMISGSLAEDTGLNYADGDFKNLPRT